MSCIVLKVEMLILLVSMECRSGQHFEVRGVDVRLAGNRSL
jgi:hypothetical protein